MPLYVYQRDKSGKFIQNEKQEDSYTVLPLKNEMHHTAVGIPHTELKNYPNIKFDFFKSSHNLYFTFDQNILWGEWDKEFDDCKVQLAEFLNTNMIGPYYVYQGFVNTRQTLSVIIVDNQDVETFRKHYAKWEFNSKAEKHNQERWQAWREGGWQMQDDNIRSYTKEP
jgi:hypothetical protein